jgi:hypothetical protein
MFALILASSSTLASPCDIVSSSHIELTTPVVTVGDVVDAKCLALGVAPHLGRIGVVRLSRLQSQTQFSTYQIQRLVHQAVPGFNLAKGHERIIEFKHAQAAPSVSLLPTLPCYRSRIAIAKGAIVSRHNLDAVTCSSDQDQLSVRYDRRYGVTRSAYAAPAGAYFGPLSLSTMRVLDENTQVSFVVSLGSVTIERSGTLLQPGFNGERAFVADEEGHVISMNMVVASPTEGVK